MDFVGVDSKKLQERRDEFLKLRARVQRDMRSEWQCTQCKKTFMGRNLRVVVRGRVEVRSARTSAAMRRWCASKTR